MLVLAGAVVSVPAAQNAPPPRPAGVGQPLAPVPYSVQLAAALEDAGRNPYAHLTRYLDFGHLIDTADLTELVAVGNDQVNLISRQGEIRKMRRVADRLYAVRVDDYGWDPAVFEDLARVNHFWLLPVTAEFVPVPAVVKKSRQVTKYDQYGRPYTATEEATEAQAPPPKKPEKTFAPVPWLPQSPAGEIPAGDKKQQVNAFGMLAYLTKSKTPIVRADEFLYETGAQQGRDGHGYYDFLGIKSRDDLIRLAGLDQAAAIKLYREYAAMVPTSGVLNPDNNRQVFGFETITGGVLFTKDSVGTTGRSNCLANLFEDYTYNAEEWVVVGPNRRPVAGLFNDKGVRQDAAPPNVANFRTAPTNDTQVHVGASCWMCHVDGLKPYTDYARQVYRPATGLSLANLARADKGSYDVEAFKRRADSAYLGPGLASLFARMTATFGASAKEACGLAGAPLQQAWIKQWTRAAGPVTLRQMSADCRVSQQEFTAVLRDYSLRKKVIDPVLGSALAGTPVPAAAWKDRFPVAMGILMGGSP